MTKTLISLTLAVLLNVLVGCHSADSGKSQLLPEGAKQAAVAEARIPGGGETDIVEQMSTHRHAYRAALESLVDYYTGTGNHMKLGWAKDELRAMDEMPQYNYIVEAAIAGPNLRASHSIALADYMYEDAIRTQRKAGRLLLFKSNDLLREALDGYNQLIRQHPSSDKIDDAAYRAGRICEDLKDYSVAIVYYQRAYQWDPATPYPARYRQALVLDQKLHRRAEALELYQQSLQKEDLSSSKKEWAVQRIDELTGQTEELEE